MARKQLGAAPLQATDAVTKVYVDGYVQSRGTDLVTNGSAFLGDNTNFSQLTYDPVDAPPGTRGSFDSARSATLLSDEFIPVDATRRYSLTAWIKQKNPLLTGTKAYFGFAAFDAQGNSITPTSYSYYPNSSTTLAAPLNPGDTQVVLSAADPDWAITGTTYVTVWNWVDPAGRLWPAHTYSRNNLLASSVDGTTVTLSTPYAGAPVPAGTPVSRGRPGSTYVYAWSGDVPTEWTNVGKVVGTLHTAPTASTAGFPYGTATVRIMMLTTYQNTGVPAGEVSIQSFAGISMSDAVAAMSAADAALAAANTKITAFADPNADRLVFWDDSAGQFAALTPSTGLTVSGTNMTVRAASEGQTGIAETATSAEVAAGTDALRYVTPLRLKERLDAIASLSRLPSAFPNAVIVGSSNVTANTGWPGMVCNALGYTERNFAVSGAGYQGTSDDYSVQLERAAASTAFTNASVGLIIIADTSNNTRAKTTATTMAAKANTLCTFSRATFPNARVVFLPIIWPSDPSAYAFGVPGGFQSDWNVVLSQHMAAVRQTALENQCEFVEDSWTWLTGRNEWMSSNMDVHPNAAGYAQIGYWMLRYFRGESTTQKTAWVNAPYIGGNAANGSDPVIQAQRIGWDVEVRGMVRRTQDAQAGYTDLATLPAGFRPNSTAEVGARFNGQAVMRAATIYSNGTIRLWENASNGSILILSGKFSIG